MKRYIREASILISWGGLILCTLLMLIVAATFKVKDMTLYRGEVRDYNQGFTLITPDGEEKSVELPYSEKGEAYTTYSLVKNLDENDAGNTISFYVNNAFVNIYVGEEKIYSFGYSDFRLFGQSPGSIQVFANIPKMVGRNAKLRIEVMSPYSDTTAKFGSIIIGEKDQCILHFVRSKAVDVCLGLLTAACIFALIAVYMSTVKLKKKTSFILFYSVFAMLVNLWLMLETNITIVFTANQTFTYFFFYICMFVAPMFACECLKNTDDENIKKAYAMCQQIEFINLVLQIILQITGVLDFRQMAPVTYLIILGNCCVIFVDSYLRMKKVKNNRGAIIEGVVILVLVFAVGVGVAGKITGQGNGFLVCIRGALLLHAIMMVVYCIKDYVVIDKNEEELQKEKMEDTKTKFLSQVSHEVRTPINTILGYSDMILKESSENNITQYAGSIDEAGKNLMVLFNDILYYTELENDTVNIRYEKYFVRDFVEKIAEYARYRTQSKNLDFKITCDAEIPVALNGDMQRMNQIMSNIIYNAVKYTNDGSVEVEIGWNRTTEYHGDLVMSVKDTGIGMLPENVAKISESFERFDERNTQNISGLGLGLSVVTRLLKKMSGKLEVESVFGKGSTFTVIIGQDIIDRQILGEVDFTRYVPAVATEQGRGEFYAPGLRILAVDDNIMNLELFKKMLKETGVRVDFALNGRDAIRMMKKKDYDIIFMDHMMPVMNGIEALHEMKKLDLCPDAKVVVFTANALGSDRDMYYSEGFDDYLSKPVKRERLIEVIKKHIPEKKREAINAVASAGRTGGKSTYNSDKPYIVIIDDDPMTLKIAAKMLSEKFVTSTCASAEEAFAVMADKRPDLILLDLHMPNVSGFEMMEKLKADEDLSDVPVVFLTGDDDEKAEVQGFKAGAADFIKKPFVADIAISRIGRIVELQKLRDDLSDEVDRLTQGAEDRRQRMESFSVEMMLTLAATIDAKDHYTKGHSNRVAEYSREIARRMGMNEQEQNEIYYMGLLHDIGKIGIPDEIINKATILTDEEYKTIKNHTIIGADILKNVTEMPFIAEGARWHHERYDGKGYPDGLAGTQIPQRARIIAVADAYDAMTSHRSYRDKLSQEEVRKEFVTKSGLQFDPEIAAVMVQMIDEDTEFELHD
ncbi:MAG: response regulator [Lachnospiraceae bacterium]|nr:response regulator [Lachnospiraceae bacterium]